MVRTSKNDFAIFCDAASNILALFGFTEYTIHFQHVKMDGETWASVQTDLENRFIVLSLNTDIDSCRMENIVAIAHHEAIEALLGTLGHMARSRNFSEDAWCAERHSVINKIQNALYKISPSLYEVKPNGCDKTTTKNKTNSRKNIAT